MNRVAIVATACAVACSAAPAKAAVVINAVAQGTLFTFPGCVIGGDPTPCMNPTRTPAAYSVRVELPNSALTDGGFYLSDRGGPFNLYTLSGRFTSSAGSSATGADLQLRFYGPLSLDEFRGSAATFAASVDDRVVTSPQVTFAAVTPVPESATWAMLVGGFGALGTVMRRRRYAARSLSLAS